MQAATVSDRLHDTLRHFLSWVNVEWQIVVAFDNQPHGF